MKRQFLLTISPALMVLSACAGANAAPKQEANLFLEDNLAHEEVFGDAGFAENLGIKQPLRAAEDIAEPTIGVQFKNYTKEYEGENRNYCAIRYVAAIASTHVKAEWIRGVSRQDGYELKAKGIKESTVAYTSVNNGGTPLVAASGSKFVVYSLLDIPLFDYIDNDHSEKNIVSCYWSYVAAGLKLTDVDDPTQSTMSKVVAVEIGHHHSFSFVESALDARGYFAQGKLEGSASESVVPLPSDGDDNHAKKVFDLKTSDQFGVFRWSASNFNFYGAFNCKYDSFYLEQNDDLANNYATVRKEGQYTLYVNKTGSCS